MTTTNAYRRTVKPIDKLTGGWRMDVTHLYGDAMDSDDVWYVFQHRTIESGAKVNLGRGYVARLRNGNGAYVLYDCIPDGIAPQSEPKTQDDFRINAEGEAEFAGTFSIITAGSPDAAARKFGNIKIASQAVLTTGHQRVAAEDLLPTTDALLEAINAEDSLSKNAKKRLKRLAEQSQSLRLETVLTEQTVSDLQEAMQS
jgi:hypothetical protein